MFRVARRKAPSRRPTCARVRAELRARLEALGDEKGQPIGTRALYPEEIYRECRGIAPDLVVYLGNLDWRSAGTVGNPGVHIFDNDTGPDDANHAQEGIFVWHGRGKTARVETARFHL